MNRHSFLRVPLDGGCVKRIRERLSAASRKYGIVSGRCPKAFFLPMPGARAELPIRYARDLRPLAAIPLDAISASLHRLLIGTPRCAWAPGGTHEYVALKSRGSGWREERRRTRVLMRRFRRGARPRRTRCGTVREGNETGADAAALECNRICETEYLAPDGERLVLASTPGNRAGSRAPGPAGPLRR